MSPGFRPHPRSRAHGGYILGVLAALVALPLGCITGSAAPPPPGGDGVDDVKAACLLRAQWTRATEHACVSCTAIVRSPACSCNTDPHAGQCVSQEQAMQGDPDCSMAITMCVGTCMPQDCACVDACYAGHDRCRASASAIDGCVTDVCDATCR